MGASKPPNAYSADNGPGSDNAERLRAIVDTAVDGIITIDDSGVIETLNPAAERLFGFAAHEIVGQNINTLMPSPFREEHNGYLRQYLTTGIRKIIGIGREVVGLRRDGSQFPMELAVSEMQLGGRRMFTGIVRDITDRRSAEEKLRRLAAVLEDSSDAIKVLDLDGNIKEWNPGAERIYGYSRADALNLNIREILPADRQEEISDAIARRRRGEKVPPLETKRVTRDGRLLDVLTTMTLLEGWPGSEAAVVITDRDITEQKKSEAALKDNEAWGRAIVETAVDGIITINSEGIIESVNSAAERTFGHEAAAMLGQNVNMLMPDPFATEHDGYLRRYCLTGRKKIIGVGREVVGKRRDGSTFPMDLSISEVRVGERRIFTGIVRDISERKRIEQDLVDYARKVECSNEVLKERRDSAEAAAEARSTFLAHMSHEIRTPMTAVLGFAELLLEDKEAAASPEWRRSTLQTIIRNGEHLLSLINEILDFSKIEAGRLTVEEIPTSVPDLIRDVVDLMRIRSEAKGLSLNVRCEGPLPDRIMSDPLRLRQILINVIGNAIKFTEKGSVNVVCRHLAEPKAQLTCDVIDTGVGISPTQAGRLFAPFSQADSSTTREFGGTGLGLVICRRLAELMRGQVSLIRSQPGVGSTFRITVSARPVPGSIMLDAPFDTLETQEHPLSTAAESPSETPGTPPLAGLHVLLAEDGPDNQRLITHMLRKSGATVTLAENGRAATLAVLTDNPEAKPFDLILMDMQMPIMDGYDATRHLRNQGYRHPIVALTAHAMAGEREKCLQSGCSDYLTKPITMKALVTGIRNALASQSRPIASATTLTSD